MSTEQSMVTKADIITGLRNLGLKAGDRVVVHSSLKAFGHVEGGPDTIIDALEEIVTEEGTIVMPTFSSEFSYFFEAIARRMADQGKDGFHGTLQGLWDEFKEFADETNFKRFPYDSPETLWAKIRSHAKSGWKGWTVTPDADGIALDAPVSLVKHGDPLPHDEVKTWKMPIHTGIIPWTFSKRPETRRSEQFTGSFTAWGALTDEVLERHDNHSHQEPTDHPLYRMMKAGGKILLLGVTHHRDSSVHIAQSTAKRERGATFPGEYLGDFMNVDEPLTSRGQQTIVRIGNADVRLADTQALFAYCAEVLEEKMAAE